MCVPFSVKGGSNNKDDEVRSGVALNLIVNACPPVQS